MEGELFEREKRQIEEAVWRANCCEVSPWGYRLILFTESPSAGTIDSEQWQTQSILMTPLQDYYCTFKFKVAMAMDQSTERFKTLRVHCSVTFHPQQIETMFCLPMLQSLWRLVPLRIVHARNFFVSFCLHITWAFDPIHFTFLHRDGCNSYYGI